MASKYEDLLKLAQAQDQRTSAPTMPAANPTQNLLQALASIAMRTGNPNTERGQIFSGAGDAYMTGINQQNKQQFFTQVSQISKAPIAAGEKINLLMSLKAQHGTDYDLGLDDIVKQYSDMAGQQVQTRGQDITLRGQDLDERAKKRELAAKTYQAYKDRTEPKEYKPRTKEEAIAFESAKAGFKPPTQAQEATALYASRIKQADEVFASIEDFINTQGMGEMAQAGLPEFANFMKSEDMQSYQQAQRNFLNAVLRRESGAVISPSEFKEGRQQYFPQPGDKPAVIAQKKANRDLVKKNFISAAGNAYRPYEEAGGLAPTGGGAGSPPAGAVFFSPSTKKFYDQQGNEL